VGFLDVAKFTSLTPSRFKNVFPAYFGIEIKENVCLLCRQLMEHTFQFFVEAASSHHQFYLLLEHERSEQ
jgi:hypothetical protein